MVEGIAGLEEPLVAEVARRVAADGEVRPVDGKERGLRRSVVGVRERGGLVEAQIEKTCIAGRRFAPLT